MAIVNRDKQASEQKEVLHSVAGATATGTTRQIAVMPYPATLEGIRVQALGVSNAMQLAMEVYRFVAGAGATTIPVGISNLVLVNAGTSGIQGFSGLAAAGSTLLQLQAGDVLQYTTSVSNGNATSIALNAVIKKTQDIVSYNGDVA
jgi:hypothetical protein